MNPTTSSRITICPDNQSGIGIHKRRPAWGRAACAALSLVVWALGAASANAGINWTDTDLGGPTSPGYSVTNSNGTLDIFGGGADIWGGTSQCHYYYAWASGTNWDVTMQVQNLATVDATWTKCELMVDWANTATGPQGSDPFIAAMNTPPGGDNEFGVDQFRSTSGGNADWKQAGNSPRPVYPNVWMGIHRSNSVFTVRYSYDGASWTNYISIDTSSSSMVGQDNGVTFGTPFPNLVCVGVAVTAHNDTGGLADATVADLTANFAGITAPTVVNTTVQVSNVTAVAGSEASFSFATTNNSSPNVVVPTYQWYTNGVAMTNATGESLTWLAQTTDNGAQVYCVATVPVPYNTSVTTVKSATGTLTVVNSGVQHNNGLKLEFFSGAASCAAVEAGNVTPANFVDLWQNWDNPGGYGNYYADRVSGYFIPPTSDNYVFFVAADDTADLFLSTNSSAANKEMIAQVTAWTDADNWLAVDGLGVAGAGNNNFAQSRSDTFVNPVTSVSPYPNGIPLVAGHLYYIEGVHYQGTGGDDFTVTYQTESQMAKASWSTNFVNGTHSLLQATNGNLAFISYPDTTPTWTLQPTNITVTAGTGGGFTAGAVDGGEFAPNYQWYSNSVPITGATAATLYYVNMPTSAGGQQYYCVASGVVNGMAATSSVVSINISTPVLEHGWAKVEYWYPGSLAALEAGTLGISTNVITSPKFEQATVGNTAGNNYASRMTTLFYPATSGNYDFYLNADDQADLFVSTDSTPGNKHLVAQEAEWSNAWQWEQEEGAALVAPQKQSPTFSPDNGATTPWSGGIPMVAGQAYYIELDHQDTGGGNNSEATFELHGQAAPVNGTYSALTGNLIAIDVPKSFNLGFTAEPTNTTVPLYGVANFTVAAVTDSKIAVGTTGDPRPLWTNTINYQWLKNGTPITGANGQTYSFGPVTPADIGNTFTCQIRSLGLVDNSGNDIWSNSVSASITGVTGGAVLETGYALHRYWGGNPGRTTIEANTAGTPDWEMSSPAFELDILGTEVADNFCDDLLGSFVPATSGNYVFFCNSDDDADVYLSTDNTFVNCQLIAQQTSYGGGVLKWSSTVNGTASQVRSDTFVNSAGATPFANGIPLVAGQQYAIRIVHHQGGGGTYSCVTAKLIADADPVDGTLSTIRGTMLQTYVPPCTYVTITNQPKGLTVTNYGSVSFSITAGTDSTLPIGPEGDWRTYYTNFLAYQWYKNGVAISGANSATYSLSPVLPSDNNDQIVCETRALGYADNTGKPIWASSQAAALTVITNAPQLSYSAYYANTNYEDFSEAATNYIIVAFTAPMDPVRMALASTYTLPAGLTILSVIVNTNDYRSVALAVSGTITLPINVQVSPLLTGMGGGLPVANTSVALHTVGLKDSDIGVPGTDPAIPGMMYVEGPNAYTILTEGSDIWNNADGFNYAYEPKTNDFDVVVRQKDNKHTSNWAKGGLMIRETLDAGSRNWNIINDPAASDGINAPDNSGYGANAVECNARNSTNGATAAWDFNPRPVPAYPNAWVRLKRTGNLLSAFYSTNGTSWTLQATNDPTQVGDKTALPSVVYVGLCTTAHNNDAVGTAPGDLLYVNTVDYDNYNSSYVATSSAPAVLAATVAGNQITVTWTPNVGRLLASPALTGPNVNWQQVGTGGSVTLPTTGSSMFFQVVNP